MTRTFCTLTLTCLLVGSAGAETTTTKKHASAATKQPSMDEMMKATAVFERALAKKAAAA